MARKINVVMGGPSAEHEVSLATGREVLLHLNRSKYTPRAVVITRELQFYVADAADVGSLPAVEELAAPENSDRFQGPYAPGAAEKVWGDCEAAFLALHGEFGEDGVIQGYLDTLGIPYNGSGVLGSAVCLNKVLTKRLFEQAGIPTPPYSIVDGSGNAPHLARLHGLPCYVKCPQSGSSRLMGRADTVEQLAGYLKEFSQYSEEVLVETTVTGMELSCPVLEYPDGSVRTLPAVLIRPAKSSYFDFEAKYTDGACEEIVPAPIDESVEARIREIALQAHKLCNCRGLSRTDVILQESTIYALEINSLPGLTSQSLAPKSFAAQEGDYEKLLDVLLRTAIELPRNRHK